MIKYSNNTQYNNKQKNRGYKKLVSQNNGVPVTNKVIIDETGIHSTNINTNHRKDYLFEQILSITETKNLLILKMERPLALILDKNNLKGGRKEEVIEFLFEKCKNIKKKIVYNVKIRNLKDSTSNNEKSLLNEEEPSENYQDSKTDKVELNEEKKKLHNINDNILSRKFKERYNESSEEIRRKIDMIDSSTDASEYQLKVIKRKKIYPEINDVFILNPCDNIYLVGVVLNNHINNISGEDLIVIAISDKIYSSLEIKENEINFDNLLFAPLIVGKEYWTRGYFFNTDYKIGFKDKFDYSFYNIFRRVYMDEYQNIVEGNSKYIRNKWRCYYNWGWPYST